MKKRIPTVVTANTISNVIATEHYMKLADPIKIRVSTGGKRGTYMARSLVEAFELFLDSKQPKALGVLVEFKAKGWDPVDDTFYMSTVAALEKLGRFSEE